MRRVLVVVVLCVLCVCVLEARVSIPRTRPDKDLAPLGSLGPKAEDDLVLSPYVTGDLTYRGEKLMWFAVVEKRSNTVGVVVLSKGRRDFRKNAGPEIPIVVESFRKEDQVVTYLPFATALCEPATLESLSCAFKEFTDDIVAKLRRVPEFLSVCASAYVGTNQEQTPTCQSQK
ncbi:MAG: hypothetical protein AAB490_02610 [Patescibacteria group bacterium]